jgi:hypothetical protein
LDICPRGGKRNGGIERSQAIREDIDEAAGMKGRF